MKQLLHIALLFLIISCAVMPNAWAQLDQVLRLEITPKEKDNELYNVISLKEAGLLVSSQTVYPEGGSHTWQISRYDTMLNKMWEKTYLIRAEYVPTKVFQNEDYLYVLLTQNQSLKMSIFRLDFSNGDSEVVEGSLLTYLDITHFKVMSNTAYIGGRVKYRPVVVAFNFFDKRSRILPAMYEANSEVSELEVDNYENTLDVILYNINRRRSDLLIKSYDYGGRLLKNMVVPSSRDKTLQSGRISALNEDEHFLMGNYSVKNLPYAQGMYISKMTGDKQDFIKYYKFNDFENFFSFMKPRRQERVRNRIVKKREKGKEYQLRYRLLLHDIIEQDDQYILIGEAFYPQYRSNSFYGYGYYGNGRYSDRIFDGYKYTHAVVCGFDKKGNLLWDNSFGIQDFVSYHLVEAVKVAVDEDKIVLVYPHEETLNTKIIKGNQVVKDKENYPIKTNFEHDKVVHSEDAKVSDWYGKYFITWGEQEINNAKDSGVKSTRKVFFLNKITYQTNPATTNLQEQK